MGGTVSSLALEGVFSPYDRTNRSKESKFWFPFTALPTLSPLTVSPPGDQNGCVVRLLTVRALQETFPSGDTDSINPTSFSTIVRRCKTNNCVINQDNPSLWSPKCREFAEKKLVGFKFQMIHYCHFQHELSNDTIVARIGGGPGEPGWLDCYPWPADLAPHIEAFHHKPYVR